MSSRPTVDSLNTLFDELITRITDKLKDPECPASILKEARELLKDNGIEATDEGLSKLREVDNLLPFTANSES